MGKEIYYSVLSWINAHHHAPNPMATTPHILLALDITMMVYCGYQIVKPWLSGKAS
jgi:hypothetical protein